MRIELRDNPAFLRYHEILRRDPSSIVFAPLAEMLNYYNCYEEAITVCKKGLEKNPELVSGRIALAKAYLGVGNDARAAEEAAKVLKIYPGHPDALRIAGDPVKKAEQELSPSALDPADDARWNTVTMAEIFASQGNADVARKIYNDVLKREPGNFKALKGLAGLEVSEE